MTIVNSELFMAKSPSGEQVTTSLIQTEEEWDALREKWDELYAASPTASTPLDFVWLRSWWRVYQSAFQAGELKIIAVWRATRLIGVMPLFMHRGTGGVLGVRRLGLISTGEAEFEETCPDYLNILCLPGEETVCVDAVWDAIGLMSWDHLELLDLPEDTPLLQTQQVPHNAQRLSRGTCPIADLTGGFEEYLERQSANSRQQVRRLIREGERAGARFEIIGEDQISDALNDLIRLHQERWTADGKLGVFSAPRFVEFHGNLVRQWQPIGRAVLARLSIASEPVAVLYGFVTGKTFDFYQSGVRVATSDPLRSPGNLAHLLLMRALIERGVTAYDFLRGSSTYKERLATRNNKMVGIQVWRPTLRAMVYRSVRLIQRIVRKGLTLGRRLA